MVDGIEDTGQTNTELSNEAINEAVEKSSAVMLEYQQRSGAYPSSPNFAVYNYSWFRDGSFVANGMNRTGQIESAERFFDWCSKIVVDRRDQILSGGKLNARYCQGPQILNTVSLRI
jgi:GH15 family glucan-1,4-alpha-glucosidase